MDELKALAAVPIFSAMDRTEIAALRALMARARFEPNEVINALNEPEHAFYVVIEGRVQFTVQDAAGNELVVDEVGPSGFFGEVAMLTGISRAVRAQARGRVVALTLDRATFFSFLQHHEHAVIDVITVLGQRLQHTDRLLHRSVSRNVNELLDDQLTLGQRIADGVAATMGSWRFILIQSSLLIVWIALNLAAWVNHWDPYPFILLNLALSFQAAYAAPFIMMSQNRQAAKDRLSAEIDHQVNSKAEVEIGLVLRRLDQLEQTLHRHTVVPHATLPEHDGTPSS